MFAPLAVIRQAMTVIAAGVSGLPSTVTCSRPGRAGEGAPRPAQAVVISASRPRIAGQRHDPGVDAGQVGQQPVEISQRAEHQLAADRHLLLDSTTSGCRASEAKTALKVTPASGRVSVIGKIIRK